MRSLPVKPGPRLAVACVLLVLVLAVALPVAWNRPGPHTNVNVPPRDPHAGPPAATERRPKVFRFFQETPNTLDPALASDAYSCTVIAQIYSPLVGLTSNLEPTPQVAESWTISRDGKTYVFHIRPGVRFHHGREVTADDFVFSLTRLFTEPFRSEGLAAGYLDAIEGVSPFVQGKAKTISGIRALDSRRLEIRLSRPYRPLLSAQWIGPMLLEPQIAVEDVVLLAP